MIFSSLTVNCGRSDTRTLKRVGNLAQWLSEHLCWDKQLNKREKERATHVLGRHGRFTGKSDVVDCHFWKDEEKYAVINRGNLHSVL